MLAPGVYEAATSLAGEANWLLPQLPGLSHIRVPWPLAFASPGDGSKGPEAKSSLMKDQCALLCGEAEIPWCAAVHTGPSSEKTLQRLKQ